MIPLDKKLAVDHILNAQMCRTHAFLPYIWVYGQPGPMLKDTHWCFLCGAVEQ